MNTTELIKAGKIDWSKVTNPKVKDLYDNLVVATSNFSKMDADTEQSLATLAKAIEQKFPDAVGGPQSTVDGPQQGTGPKFQGKSVYLRNDTKTGRFQIEQQEKAGPFSIRRIFTIKSGSVIPGQGIETPTVRYTYLLNGRPGTDLTVDEEDLTDVAPAQSTPQIAVIGSGSTGAAAARLAATIADRYPAAITSPQPPPRGGDAPTESSVNNQKPQTRNPQRETNIAAAIASNSSNKIKARKKAKGIEQARILSIKDTFEMYNRALTQAELDAWLICYPGHVLNQHYKPEHSLQQLLDKGLLYYEADKNGNISLAYKYLYLAGDIALKLRRIEQYRDAFVAEHGQAQYDKQIADLEKELPIPKRVDATNDDDRIFIVPHAEFAKNFMITSLHPECEARLYNATSLYEAFEIYLGKIGLDKFQPSTKEDVQRYVKNKAITLNQVEKRSHSEEKAKEVLQSRKNRAKQAGDRLFAFFLENCLNDIDVQVINREWNRKFNGIKEIRLEKIPVAVSHNSVFKKGSPLRLSDTQRNGVAGYEAKKSIMFGFDVGVGKTLALCAAVGNSFETGRASIHLQVVPDATYKKWIYEIHGGKDKDGRYIHGAIPQYNFLGWGNLNTTIVQREVREYTEEEQKVLKDHEKLKDGINKVIASFSGKVNKAILQELIKQLNAALATASFEQFLRDEMQNVVKASQSAIDNESYEQVSAGFLGGIGNFKDKVNEELNINIYTLGAVKPIPDKTIILVNYTGMVRMGLSAMARQQIRTRLYTILSQGELDPKDEAALTKQIDASIGQTMREAKLYLDEVGIDSFGIDEAHNMKKSFTKIAGEVTGSDDEGNAKRGTRRYELDSGAPSQQGIHAFCLSQYVQANNGGANVITLTATPFTNNPLEVYSMLALTNYNRLEETGHNNLLEFFNTFIREETQLVINAKGKPEFKPIVVGFNNLPQLRQIIFDIIDIKTGEDAKVVRPEAIGIPDTTRNQRWGGVETYLQPSAQQKFYFQKIQDYMEGGQNIMEICEGAMENENMCTLTYEYIQNLQKNMAFDPEDEPESVRVLRSLSFQRLLAISPYLFACNDLPCPTAQQYVEDSPKLDYVMKCIRQTKEYFEKKKERVPGQVIYMNAGTRYFSLIKEYLTDPQFGIGFDKKEVELVFGEVTKAQKENIKERFLAGECKVIIGSQTIAEGIDLQDYSTDLFIVLADWNPTQYRQVAGRIHRQGNAFAYVRITSVLMADSADVFTFQKLQEKTQRIKELLDKEGRKSSLDLDDVNPSEIKENLITDPRVKASMQIKRIVKELENKQVIAEDDLMRLERLRNNQQVFMALYPRVVDIVNRFNKAYGNWLKEADRKEELERKRKHEVDGMSGEYESRFNPEADKYQLEQFDASNFESLYVERINRRMIFVMQKWNELKAQPEGAALTEHSMVLEDLIAEFRNVKPHFLRGSEQLGSMGLTVDKLYDAIMSKTNEVARYAEEIAQAAESLEERVKSNESQREAYLASLKTVDERVAEFGTLNKYLDERMSGKPEKEEELIEDVAVGESGMLEVKEESAEMGTQDIKDALDGLKLMFEMAEGAERQDYQDAIEGLEVLLELEAA